MHQKLQIAIIGCGSIANGQHIPAYLANNTCEIKYFCDIIPERADRAVSAHGGKAVYDYREILNDPDLDAVSVCTHNNNHAPISIDFLNAGKHVLCEKPAARTYADALKMQEAQHKTGKVLNIGVVNRFNTAVNRIRDMVNNGDLGEVYAIYGSFRAQRSIPGMGGDFTTKAVSGGGVLIDWGVHVLDLIMYISGDPLPKTVSGHTFCKLGKNMRDYVYTSMWAGEPKYDGTYDVDDYVTGMIRTEGPTITINGAWAQNVSSPGIYIEFMGDKGGVHLNYGGDYTFFTTRDGALIEEKHSYVETDMFKNEINAFLDCIRSGEKIASHIDNAVITSKIMQGLYDSSDAGKEIQF
ncbi:MAG: Gfo/Idh/MocA family oxidoreductase [Oscillospiraceae bacterium]|nr:Gfo/Idh/MocA family oxidoreductase [Oscillospiraceae bacterium]